MITTETQFKKGDRVTLNAYAMSRLSRPKKDRVGKVVGISPVLERKKIWIIWDGNKSRSGCLAELLTIAGKQAHERRSSGNSISR